MYAELSNDLITGNELIDSQHRELIGRINDLLISCENKGSKKDAVQMLEYLSNYVNYHFDAEEGLQRELKYPGYEDHLKKHAELRQTVEDLKAILNEGDGLTDTFTQMVKERVLDWLLYHIGGFDRSIAEFKFMTDNTDRL